MLALGLALCVAALVASLGKSTSAQSTPGAVLDELLITEDAGGFGAELDDYYEFVPRDGNQRD